MEDCFADKLATCKLAMGSNEPLGKPIEVVRPRKPIDLESQEANSNGEGFVEGQAPFDLVVKALMKLLLHLLAQIERGRELLFLVRKTLFRLATFLMHRVMWQV
jgi:hypothetical protein